MSVRTLALGSLATLLAVAQVAGWLAIGSLFVRGVAGVVPAVTSAILIGSGLLGFAYAVLCAAGHVGLAIVAGAAASTLSLLFRWRWVAARLRELGVSYARAFANRPVWRLIAVATALLYWVVAIAPPRDADVMRYHLAHIRQILEDGAWLPIPDYCYAIPFGFSLNYLPFEYLDLPQGAHLLNWALLLIAVACLLELVRELAGGWHSAAILLCGVFAYQLWVLKSATTAHADMYLAFEILGVAAFLVRGPLGARELGLLGFVSWIGMQSRYQAAAVGLGASVVLLLSLRSWEMSRQKLLAFALGSGAALALCLPFYAMNWIALENPVWPLLTGLFQAQPSYADRVAEHFNSGFTGELDAATLLRGLRGLALDPMGFPVPLMAGALLLVALLQRRSERSSRLAWFVAVYLLIWAVTNPSLYARFTVVLLPAIVVGGCALPWFADAPAAIRRVVTAALGVAVLAMIVLCGFYSWDSLVLLVTGDAKRYHEFTWFYEVYDWANQTTPEDARFLVIVESGHSYYLDRPYRRADPCLSAVIDWPNVRTGEALMEQLRAGGYNYLLYHDQDWSRCLAGEQMSEVIRSARESGLLDTVASFDVSLGTSRLLRQVMPSRALVLQPVPEH